MPLFLAQAISVAFYIIGFTESLQFLFPNLDVRLTCTGVLAVLFVIAWVGADLAIKTQYVDHGGLGPVVAVVFPGLDAGAGLARERGPAVPDRPGLLVGVRHFLSRR